MADNAESNRGEEKKARGWNPSRGFWIGMAGVALFAGVLAAAGAYGASTDGNTQPSYLPDGPVPTVQVSYAPRKTTPPDDFAYNPPAANPSVDLAPSDSTGAGRGSSAPVPAERATPSPEPAVTESAASSASVASPTPVASSMTQSPVYVPPAPAAPLGARAEALVASANADFGIEIVIEGQDWGDTDADQAANLGAVVSAWQRLPLRVTSSIVEHSHGPLEVLSNKQGRTSGGWQPFGDVATSFYTNSDQGVDGYRAANQVVLATGADEETVLHELLHAYALRNIGPDDYVLAFLDGEMQSFMAATGWEMAASEDELLAAAREPWDVVNALFGYTGDGRFDAANPLEAFASAGAKYFLSGEPEAGCREFAWFAENLS